jgi:glycosyltransferase involved in cell wall biosynthesis
VLRIARQERLDVLNLQYQAAAYGMHPAVHFLPRRSVRPPVVVTFHDLRVPYLFPKAGPLRWRVVRMLARRADGVIVTNHEDYRRLEREIPRERLALIPIGSNIPPVPPPNYDRDAERARWGVGPDDLLLGYFGFLNESKGGEELIRALARLVADGVPAHLLMVGGRVGTSDPTNRAYAARIDGLIAELGLAERVHWTGYTDPQAVSAGLLATDVCVLPLPGRRLLPAGDAARLPGPRAGHRHHPAGPAAAGGAGRGEHAAGAAARCGRAGGGGPAGVPRPGAAGPPGGRRAGPLRRLLLGPHCPPDRGVSGSHHGRTRINADLYRLLSRIRVQ